MKTAGNMLVLTLVFVGFAAVSGAAESARGLEGLVGKWSGWGTPMSGKQAISGAGRNEAGPFNYDLTKQ
jgi:hypothetical protein